jgi:hypothetical protein
LGCRAFRRSLAGGVSLYRRIGLNAKRSRRFDQFRPVLPWPRLLSVSPRSREGQKVSRAAGNSSRSDTHELEGEEKR